MAVVGVTAISTVLVGAAPAAAQAAPCNDTLTREEGFKTPGFTLTSCNQRFVFSFQTDSNLVVTAQLPGVPPAPIWNAGTTGLGLNELGFSFPVEPDSVFAAVVAGQGITGPYWIAGGDPTTAVRAVKLVMQDDGNLVLYNSAGQAVWFTGSAGGSKTVTDAPRSGGETLVATQTAQILSQEVPFQCVRLAGGVSGSSFQNEVENEQACRADLDAQIAKKQTELGNALGPASYTCTGAVHKHDLFYFAFGFAEAVYTTSTQTCTFVYLDPGAEIG